MGCCFSSEADSTPSSSSNLISGPQKKYVEENGSGAPPISARQHRPPDKINRDRRLEDDLQVPKIKPIPISEIAKTFQDHELLYEDLKNNYTTMMTDMHDFKKAYEAETSGIPQLPNCVQILSSRCGNTSLDVKRRKNSVLIEFSERDLMKNCISEPTTVVQSLNLFNSLNKHLEKVLDRGQTLLGSINVVISDEKKLRLQVTKSSLPASEGTEAMHNLMDNIKILGRMADNINFMQKRCDETFKVVLESSKVFFNTS